MHSYRAGMSALLNFLNFYRYLYKLTWRSNDGWNTLDGSRNFPGVSMPRSSVTAETAPDVCFGTGACINVNHHHRCHHWQQPVVIVLNIHILVTNNHARPNLSRSMVAIRPVWDRVSKAYVNLYSACMLPHAVHWWLWRLLSNWRYINTFIQQTSNSLVRSLVILDHTV